MKDKLKQFKIVQIINDVKNNRTLFVQRGFDFYDEKFLPKMNDFFTINVFGKHRILKVDNIEDNTIYII